MRKTEMDMRIMHCAIANLQINAEGLLAASLRMRRELQNGDLTLFDNEDRIAAAEMVHSCALQFRLLLQTLERADAEMRGAHDTMHPGGEAARKPDAPGPVN